jgi:AraC-like DNA-binding protein
MSRALAVFHGCFGRATVYQLNRAFSTHAHREGHLIFQVGGTPGHIRVGEETYWLDEETVVAVNPWAPHNFVPTDFDDGALFFVLYVNADWFTPNAMDRRGISFGRSRIMRTPAIARHVRRAAAMVCGEPSLPELDRELRNLIAACHAESWAQSLPAAEISGGVTDFRVRKSIKLLSEASGAEVEFDEIAREAGLSRPHFYKLFRAQTGVTPHLYLNTLLMEKALDALVSTDAPMAEIGGELGFSSQSVFTRFFAGHVGMAPSDYRRAAKVLRS